MWHSLKSLAWYFENCNNILSFCHPTLSMAIRIWKYMLRSYELVIFILWMTKFGVKVSQLLTFNCIALSTMEFYQATIQLFTLWNNIKTLLSSPFVFCNCVCVGSRWVTPRSCTLSYESQYCRWQCDLYYKRNLCKAEVGSVVWGKYSWVWAKAKHFIKVWYSNFQTFLGQNLNCQIASSFVPLCLVSYGNVCES